MITKEDAMLLKGQVLGVDVAPLNEYHEACDLPGLLRRVRTIERDCIEYEKALAGLGDILNGVLRAMDILVAKVGKLETITEQRTGEL